MGITACICRLSTVAAAICLAASCSVGKGPEAETADLLVTNARIVDGTGNPWYRGSLAVRGDRISAVGPLVRVNAARIIDAGGKVLAPGFIDAHNHCEDGLFKTPDAQNFVRQGVTTLVGGPDGGGAPLMGEFLARVEKLALGLNVCFTVGQGAVRSHVMGHDDREPTRAELDSMSALVEKAMLDGAVGISTGLKYVPGSYSSTGEVIEVSRASARHGGFYTSHLREEGPGLIEAVDEAIRIAEQAGIPVNVTHHKAVGRLMWGKSVETLRMIGQARARGLDVTADQYPYTATSTGLAVLIPDWAEAGGSDSLMARIADPLTRERIIEGVLYNLEYDRGGADPLNVAVAQCGFDPSLEGLNFRRILEGRGVEPNLRNAAELVLDLQAKGGVSAIYHCLDEADVERIMASPWSMVASDGTVIPFGEGVPHPRSYGTFPRVLGRYVRERGVLGLEDAVRKMTSFPAQRVGLAGRGALREGMYADLVIFDPETVIDRATFEKPHQYPDGIEAVIVNGRVVFENGSLTAERPGRVLRGAAYRTVKTD